ncbi:MAG TPA: ABC transporter permease [Tepidisphaeraceae bacterium]|nr:ABC transporter permease [Tepidisphaeraceae bacterium]
MSNAVFIPAHPQPPAPPALADDSFELLIRPRPGWIGVNWKELAHYRELLFFLTWRDVKVRYKQSVLGVAWAVLVPVFNTIIFTVMFGHFAGMDRLIPAGMNYSVFVYAGVLPWTFFATAINLGGLSLVNQQSLLTKIYFPRLFVPAATVGGAMVDLAISFAVMAVLMAWHRVGIGFGIVALLPLLLLLTLASLGIAFTLSALTVTYRDFRFIMQFLVQAWMLLSPVIFPVTIVPARFRWAVALNPMCGVIDGFRAALLGMPWHPGELAISAAATAALFAFGLFYFRKTERRFADVA